MKILVSNDDGVYAPGLKMLYGSLNSIAKVTVVAPDRDRSAASKSLTLMKPIRTRILENGFVSVDGTPTDCVHLAVTGWLKEEPDMVVAGINAGANLGDDVLYSGTVAAAMEGRFLGFPSIAISLVGESDKYAPAGTIIKQIVNKLIEDPLPSNTILNINVPNLPIEKIKGYKVTRLGRRHQAENMIKSQDPRGHEIYWVGPAGAEQDAGPGTDFHAVKNGYVSMTPLEVDLTRYAELESLTDWSKELELECVS